MKVSESINAVVKRKVEFKQTEWPEFNCELKQIVSGQREEAIRSLSGRGQFKLCKQYEHLQTDPLKWTKMTPEQRQAHVKRFDAAGLRIMSGTRKWSCGCQGTSRVNAPSVPETLSINSLCSEVATGEEKMEADNMAITSNSTSSSSSMMSISPEECGIETLTFETVHAIWTKAEQYLKSENDIVPAPGSNTKSMMVASKTSNYPHFVSIGTGGQYFCDKMPAMEFVKNLLTHCRCCRKE